MKRISVLLVTFLLSLSVLTGCGTKENEVAENNTEAGNAVTESENEAKEAEVTEGDPMLSEINASDYVELGDYKGITVSYNVAEVTDDEVEGKIATELSRNSTTEVTTDHDVIKEGDIANIDYEGKKDGVVFESGVGKAYDLVIGSKTFIPGFESGLVGVKVGDTVDLNLTFPENYGNSELSGADVVFTVKVNCLKKVVVPELTDETVQKINPDCKTVEDYRKLIKEDLAFDKENIAVSQAKSDILDQVVGNATLKDSPKWLLSEKLEFVDNYVDSMAQMYGIDRNTLIEQSFGGDEQAFLDQKKELATEDAKKSLVVYAIAQAEGIELDEDKARESLEQYVEMYGFGTYEEFRKSVYGRYTLENLQLDEVADFLFENANLVK